jgi:hypothetical protein
VSEVLDALKEHITIQKRRHEENMRRQDVMHQERMTIMKGFLDVFKDRHEEVKLKTIYELKYTLTVET